MLHFIIGDRRRLSARDSPISKSLYPYPYNELICLTVIVTFVLS